MQTFKLKIITPEKIFFEGDAEQIIAKTTAGYVGILAGHTPYVAKLVPSALKVKAAGSDDCRIAAVSSGMIKADNKNVTVIAPAVEWAEDIDVARAERAREAAQRKLDSNNSQKEFDLAEQKLKRALNRLTVAGK
ncbi:MAG: ATP synthase F1 subunit epsilon [Oscillospiraceae bacterium]